MDMQIEICYYASVVLSVTSTMDSVAGSATFWSEWAELEARVIFTVDFSILDRVGQLTSRKKDCSSKVRAIFAFRVCSRCFFSVCL